MKRRLTVLAIAVGMMLAPAGSAFAGHLASGVKSYSGCLVSKDGVIIKIKEGTAPTSPCTGGQVQVHFSGGDITKISVTGALTVTPAAGDDGEVTIGLKPEFTLPSGCTTGAITEWNGTAWACGTDEDTTYDSGTGLALNGTTFSIAQDYRVKNTPDCPSGQFGTGFDASGTIACAAPAAGARAFASLQSPASGIGIPDDGAPRAIVTLTVPAGTYSITAIGSTSQASDREWSVSCALVAGSTELSHATAEGDDGTDHKTMAMITVSTFSATTTLSVACATIADGVGMRYTGIQAVSVG